MIKTVYWSGRTAIVRKVPAKPLVYLAKHGYINGYSLYHGRGKDHAGTDLIKSIVGNNRVLDTDPSDLPEACNNFEGCSCNRHIFDTVLSIYVINTINKKERKCLFEEVKMYLAHDGYAYFAVRGRGDGGYARSKNWKKYDDGFITSKKTFQRFYTPSELIKELKCYFKTVVILNGTSKSATVIARVSL